MTSRIALLIAVAALGAVAACSASSDPGASPSASGTANAGLGDRTFPSAAAVNVRTVAQDLFLTPSRNIACDLSASSVRCDIGRRDWATPSKPADCVLDYGNGLFIESDKPPQLACAGDSLLGATKEILEYGHALRAGDFLCDSESAALRCVNQRSGHGFTLSTMGYTMF
jgi:hypothetical protein